MLIEIVKRLEKSGELKELVQGGLISVKIFCHLDVYHWVNARIVTGSKKMEAVNEAAEQFKVCNMTVFRIIRSLEK